MPPDRPSRLPPPHVCAYHMTAPNPNRLPPPHMCMCPNRISHTEVRLLTGHSHAGLSQYIRLDPGDPLGYPCGYALQAGPLQYRAGP